MEKLNSELSKFIERLKDCHEAIEKEGVNLRRPLRELADFELGGQDEIDTVEKMKLAEKELDNFNTTCRELFNLIKDARLTMMDKKSGASHAIVDRPGARLRQPTGRKCDSGIESMESANLSSNGSQQFGSAIVNQTGQSLPASEHDERGDELDNTPNLSIEDNTGVHSSIVIGAVEELTDNYDTASQQTKKEYEDKAIHHLLATDADANQNDPRQENASDAQMDEKESNSYNSVLCMESIETKIEDAVNDTATSIDSVVSDNGGPKAIPYMNSAEIDICDPTRATNNTVPSLRDSVAFATSINEEDKEFLAAQSNRVKPRSVRDKVTVTIARVDESENGSPVRIIDNYFSDKEGEADA